MDNDIILSPIKINDLIQSFAAIVEEKIKAAKVEELQEKLISPAETCKLFNPPISKVTLTAWDKQGLIKNYRIGGKVYYKYSEIIEAVKHLKRYQAREVKQHKSAVTLK